MELTPEQIAEKFIAEGYGMHATLVNLIREYGEQQRLKAREDGFNSGYQKGLKDGQGY